MEEGGKEGEKEGGKEDAIKNRTSARKWGKKIFLESLAGTRPGHRSAPWLYVLRFARADCCIANSCLPACADCCLADARLPACARRVHRQRFVLELNMVDGKDISPK